MNNNYWDLYCQKQKDFVVNGGNVEIETEKILPQWLNPQKIEISDEEKTKYGITDDDIGKEHEIENYWEKVIINSRFFTINDKDKSILSLFQILILKIGMDILGKLNLHNM